MSDELRDEYEFDYRQAKPNRFAATIRNEERLVKPAQANSTVEGVGSGGDFECDELDAVRHSGRGSRGPRRGPSWKRGPPELFDRIPDS